MAKFDDDPSLIELALATSRRVAARVILRFGSFPDHCEDDLAQEALLAIRKAWDEGKYDPTKGAAKATFFYKVGWCELIDIQRKLTRKRRHEDGSPSEIDEEQSAARMCPDEADLLDFVEATYQQSLAYLKMRGIACRPVPRHSGLFRHRYSLAQGLTLFALKQRLGLSQRAMHHMMKFRRDIRDAIHLPRIPSPSMFTRWNASAARLHPNRKFSSRSVA